MTSASTSIEAALEHLVTALTENLVRAVVRASISDLGAFDDVPNAFWTHPARRLGVSPHAKPAVAHPPPPTRRGRGRPRANERAVRPAATRTVDRVDEDFTNVITDPGSLLEAAKPPPIAPRRKSARRPKSALLAHREPNPAPAIRPGEEVQRTTGGSVVLRRRTPSA